MIGKKNLCSDFILSGVVNVRQGGNSKYPQMEIDMAARGRALVARTARMAPSGIAGMTGTADPFFVTLVPVAIYGLGGGVGRGLGLGADLGVGVGLGVIVAVAVAVAVAVGCSCSCSCCCRRRRGCSATTGQVSVREPGDRRASSQKT